MDVNAALDKVRAEIMAGLRLRLQPSEILQNVREELRLIRGDSVMRDILAEEIRRYEFIAKRLGDADRPIEVSTLLADAGSQYAQTKDGLLRNVETIVTEALAEDAPLGEIENKIAGAIGTFRHYHKTIARTAAGAFEQATRNADLLAAGFEYFTYAGPPAERGFCKQHLGKTYSREQIADLSNGQGLDVFTYRGGFNCRHQWIPASAEEAGKKPKAKPAPKPKPAPTPEQKAQAKPAPPDPDEEILQTLHPTARETLRQYEEKNGYKADPRQLTALDPNTNVSIRFDSTQGAYANGNVRSAGVYFSPPGNSRDRVSQLHKETVFIHELGHVAHLANRNPEIRFAAYMHKDGLPEVPRALLKSATEKIIPEVFRKRRPKYGTEKYYQNEADRLETYQDLYTRFGLYGKVQTSAGLQVRRLGPESIERIAKERRDKYAKRIGADPSEFTHQDLEEAIGSAADCYAAVSKARYGWGHKESYFEQDGFKLAELVAHASEYRFARGKRGDFYRAVIDDLFPEVAGVLKEIGKVYYGD